MGSQEPLSSQESVIGPHQLTGTGNNLLAFLSPSLAMAGETGREKELLNPL